MKNQTLTNLSRVICVGAVALTFSACKTTQSKNTLKPPALSYKVAAVCTQAVNFDKPIQRTTEEKKQKREMRNRMIELKQDMAKKDVPCINGASGEPLPYATFEIPTGIEKRVVNAGAKFDSAVIFAARITTHDKDGGLVREFDESDYRRLGSIFGVQFSPRETERFVLIKADPSLIGKQEETVETGTRAKQVYNYGLSGSYSSGTNTQGIQQSFIRTYSYNGEAIMQTVFPKQKKADK